MFNTSSEYIQEITQSISNADYSLSSRRMLDFLYDYNVSSNAELKRLSYEIRQNYLTLSQDESLKITKLQEQCHAWLQLANQLMIHLPQSQVPNENTVVYSASELSKEFVSANRSFKLHPLSLEIKLGELTAVVGENGNGKTTLLRLVSGELAKSTGNVIYFENQQNDWYNIKGKIAYIPQRPNRWYGTLIDNLHFYCTIKGIKHEDNEDHVNYILHRLGLYQFRNLKWTEISSGYRLRFELAKALMMRPQLLILDEPLANLDINAQQLFIQDLKYLSQSVKNPMGVILSSQQLHELERNCQNIIFIKQGKTIYSGNQQAFATNRQANAYEIGGNFNYLQIKEYLSTLSDIKIIDSGTVFIINTPLHIDSATILKTITDKQIPVNYFRDISKSTRQLFQKDI